MKRRWLMTMLLSIAVGLAACGDDPEETPAGNNGDNNGVADAGDAGDADQPDADQPDADQPDGDQPDGDQPDGDQPDADDPDANNGDTASVTVSDQLLASASSDTVTIDEAVSEGVGWVVLHADDGGSPGDILGHSGVSDGTNSDVVVTIDRDFEDGETVHAMLHTETDPDADPLTFDANNDGPQTNGGDVVVQSFQVSLEQVVASDLVLDDLSTVLTIDSVRSKNTGWIVIHEDAAGSPAQVIGHAAVAAGDNADVEVVLDRPAEDDETLWAMLHVDDPADDDYTFDANDNPDEDGPAALARSGDMIMDSFTVQVPEGTPAVRIAIVSGDNNDYTFGDVEPARYDEGMGGKQDPDLQLYEGWRYEIVNNATGHPFEFVATANIGGDDVVVLSQDSDPNDETDTATNWNEDGDSILFDVEGNAFEGTGTTGHDGVNKYQCADHPSMTGGVIILTP